MTPLQKILEYCQDEKKRYDDPGSYESIEYYIRCQVKSDILQDIIEFIQTTIKQTEDANDHNSNIM